VFGERDSLPPILSARCGVCQDLGYGLGDVCAFVGCRLVYGKSAWLGNDENYRHNYLPMW